MPGVRKKSSLRDYLGFPVGSSGMIVEEVEASDYQYGQGREKNDSSAYE